MRTRQKSNIVIGSTPMPLLLLVCVIASACEDESGPPAPFTIDAGTINLPDASPTTPDASAANDADTDDVDAGPPPCALPTGTGTTHPGSISGAQTWTEAASPHVITFDTSIYGTLTLEPCAVVRIAGVRTITIPAGGSLIAAGAPGRPVTFERVTGGAAWATIRAVDGDVSMTHAIVRGGGDPLSGEKVYTGAIQMQRIGATGSLHIDDVEIADSMSQGIYINGIAGFDATSKDLRVHGSGSFPVHTYARVIGSLPSGVYTGNARDEIAIAGSGGAMLDTQTLHDRGVPYHVGSGLDGARMDVNATAGVAVLTIEPGVVMRFAPGGTLNIDATSGTTAAQAALIAIGTAAKPIVFTADSATAAPGHWLGIGFGRKVDPATTMQHVRVEYAGGLGGGSSSCPYAGRTGQNDAAIRIFGTAGPTAQFITNTEIISSARDGIDRGWRDDVMPDFLPTNTFTGVVGCKQTLPRTLSGFCPATVPCP